jgi:hypothetical protein
MPITNRWTATLIVVLASSAATAAPDDTGDSSTLNAPARPARGIVDQAAAPEIQNASKTVQMLLDIQNTKTLPEGKEPPTRAERASAARAVAPLSEGGGFGADRQGFAGGVNSGRQTTVRQQTAQADAVLSALPQTSSQRQEAAPGAVTYSGPAVEVDVRGWLPTSLIGFVRQHREMVLLGSGLALALAAWLATQATRRR